MSSAPFGFQPFSSLVVAQQVRMAGSEFQLQIFGAGSVMEQPNRVKRVHAAMFAAGSGEHRRMQDRKSTRLNSSH